MEQRKQMALKQQLLQSRQRQKKMWTWMIYQVQCQH
jgi:hypothetical protein